MPSKREDTSSKKTIEELLRHLTIEGTFTFRKTDDTIEIALETQDTGVVIGYHGETLEALQLILGIAISKNINRFVRVLLEVGDYRKNRTDYLESLALSARERVITQGREIPLPSLKAWERRIVHLMLQDDKDVYSESVGEGRERTLVVKPR